MIRHNSFESVKSNRSASLLKTPRIFDWGDYIMFFNLQVQATFVTVIFSIWVQVLWGNNFVTAKDVVDWTPEDFHRATIGSIFGIIMEFSKVTCVWGLSVYVAMGFVIVIVFLMGVWCRPFHLYYDTIPLSAANEQCMTFRHHMILDACFNITGDAIMLCLPIPLLIKARLELVRKCALIAVFSMGGLVILCATLNRITNFVAPMGSLTYLNWYAGEISTAMIVANVPHLWPLIARIARLGAWAPNSSGNDRSQITMQNMRLNNRFNMVGSEDNIVGGGYEAHVQDEQDKQDKRDKRELQEKGEEGFAGDDDSADDDSASRIMKTVDLTQYSSST
ncbi:UbiD family decarboxylase [Sclerotinia borealis F-4128]|uniref:UbiD family decarboxylase n=1 Tax=Sclerotinia borealis (strain F-4128) TaxID=1432307 RepID=W9C9K2_SCLBF|nr:UbiD family decarboxylase [Sclerotinia borealis F-4128]